MRLSSREISYLTWLIAENDWDGVVNFGQAMMSRNGSALRRKYKRAVERIEAHFKDCFNLPAWKPGLHAFRLEERRDRIAWYVHQFGSAGPLIDDLNNARSQRLRPKTLNYFLVSDGGRKNCRWSMLLTDKRRAEWQKVKAEEIAWGEKMRDAHSPLAQRGGIQGGDPQLSIQTQLILRSARSDFNAAIKNNRLKQAADLRAKIQSLYNVDLADNTNYTSSPTPIGDPVSSPVSPKPGDCHSDASRNPDKNLETQNARPHKTAERQNPD